MANRLEYNIIGRYADGREITAYHLQGINNDKSVKLTREQTIYLVGRGQIRNCEAQIYKDKVLLRGVGVDLAKLPTKVEAIQKDKSNTTHSSKFRLVNSLVNGTSTIGYTVMNSEGKTARLPRDKVIELAKADMVENVKYITANGKSGLTGINGFKIRDLESINMNDKGKNGDSTSSKVNKNGNIQINIEKELLELVREHKGEDIANKVAVFPKQMKSMINAISKECGADSIRDCTITISRAAADSALNYLGSCSFIDKANNKWRIGVCTGTEYKEGLSYMLAVGRRDKAFEYNVHGLKQMSMMIINTIRNGGNIEYSEAEKLDQRFYRKMAINEGYYNSIKQECGDINRILSRLGVQMGNIANGVNKLCRTKYIYDIKGCTVEPTEEEMKLINTDEIMLSIILISVCWGSGWNCILKYNKSSKEVKIAALKKGDSRDMREFGFNRKGLSDMCRYVASYALKNRE